MITHMRNYVLVLLIAGALALVGCPAQNGNDGGKQAKSGIKSAPMQQGGTVSLPLEIAPFDSALKNLDLGDPRLYALARAIEMPVAAAYGDPVGLVASYQSMGDQTWVLALTDHATKHDFGKALLKHWQRILRGGASPLREQMLDLIAGAAEFKAGKAQDISGYSVSGSALTIKLTRPDTAFMSWISQPGLGLAGADQLPPAAQTNTTGFGPFILSRIEGNELALTPNPDWPFSKPMLDELHFICEPDRAKQLELFKAGKLDACNLRPEDVAAVEADPVLSKQLVRNPTAAPVVCIIAQNDYPWADSDFQDNTGLRSALNWALDRTALADGIGGEIKEWQHFFPEAWRSDDDPALLRQPQFPLLADPGKAEKGLDDSDHTEGMKLPQTLFLSYTPGGINDALAKELLGYWKDVSLRLSPDPIDLSELRKRVELGTHDLVLRMLTPAYPDPDALAYPNLYSALYGLGGNWSMLRDPGIDKLIEQAQATSDKVTREKAYQDLSRALEEKARFVFIGYSTPAMLISPRLGGYSLTPYDFDASLPAQDFSKIGIKAP